MTDAAHQALRVEQIGCAVVTISDTRTEATDTSGKLIRDKLADHGHDVVRFQIIPDDPDLVRGAVSQAAGDGSIAAVLMTGGTGVAARDSTFEAISNMYDKELTGFGELFRFLSYEEIGAAAMLSRASAGIVSQTVVFSMPGSLKAVRLAMERLILPELPHIVALISD